MSQINHYPSELHDTQRLFLQAIKQSLKTARYLWPVIIFFTVFIQLTRLPLAASGTIPALILSFFYMLIGYLLLNIMLWRGHQSYRNAYGFSLPPRRYWLNLLSIFVCLLIPTCVWNYCVMQFDLSQIKTLLLALVLSTILIWGYLLTLYVYPLLAFQQLPLKRSLFASSYFVRQNWIRAGMIYMLLVFIVILSLPNSAHMVWLSQYYFNFPVALLVYFCLLPIVINFWLLVTMDNQRRYPHVISNGA